MRVIFENIISDKYPNKSSVTLGIHLSNMYTLNLKQYLFLEPTYFLFNLAHEIANLVDTNLYLQKTCRNYTLSEPDLSTKNQNQMHQEQIKKKNFY